MEQTNEIKSVVYYWDELLNMTVGTLNEVPKNAIRAIIIQQIPYIYNGEISFYVYEHNIYVGKEIKLEDSAMSQERVQELLKNGYDRQVILPSNLSNVVKQGDNVYPTIQGMMQEISSIKEEIKNYQITEVNSAYKANAR